MTNANIGPKEYEKLYLVRNLNLFRIYSAVGRIFFVNISTY